MIRTFIAGALALVFFLLSPLQAISRAIGLAIITVVLAVGAAHAAGTSVDFAPLVNDIVIPTVVALLGLLAAWLSKKAAGWFGLQADSKAAETLEAAMKNGLAYAQSKLGTFTSGPLAVDVRNELVAVAANYAIANVPAAMKTLGVDKDLLIQKLAARLALNTTPPELSVAVPTPPLPATAAGGTG